MAFSLLSVGHASTMGLTRTSKSPPPMAYIITASNSPTQETETIPGKMVRRISPAAAIRCAVIMEIRYPTRSITAADKRSTNS